MEQDIEVAFDTNPRRSSTLSLDAEFPVSPPAIAPSISGSVLMRPKTAKAVAILQQILFVKVILPADQKVRQASQETPEEKPASDDSQQSLAEFSPAGAK